MFNRQKIIQYLKARHLSDGGYFFARVPPSSCLDTFYAIKTLNLLKSKQVPKEDVISFFRNEDKKNNLYGIYGLYFAVSTFKLLKQSISEFSKYSSKLLIALNDKNLFTKKVFHHGSDKKLKLFDGSAATLYLDLVEGEVKNIYYLTSLLLDFKLDFDKKIVINFILSLKNDDGGFGNIKGSEISTTYYSLKILSLLSYPLNSFSKTIHYLLNEFDTSNYLEEYFWTVKSLRILKQRIPDKNSLISFLICCWKGNGGFARSQFIGIPNIEQTYQAVSLLKNLETKSLPLLV